MKMSDVVRVICVSVGMCVFPSLPLTHTSQTRLTAQESDWASKNPTRRALEKNMQKSDNTSSVKA